MRVRALPGQLLLPLALSEERRSVRYSRPMSQEDRAKVTAESLPAMPKTRSECRAQGLGWAVPCPHVQCRYHIGQDHERDQVTEFWPDRTLDQFPATCWEEIAERGPRTDLEIARITGLSVRSIERATASAFAKLRAMGLAHLLPRDDT
jgi:hypothetical protein